jgi:hypothetical protein
MDNHLRRSERPTPGLAAGSSTLRPGNMETEGTGARPTPPEAPGRLGTPCTGPPPDEGPPDAGGPP